MAPFYGCSRAAPRTRTATTRAATAIAAIIMDYIIAEEEDRRRMIVGLGGLHLSYPQVVSASIAAMRVGSTGSDAIAAAALVALLGTPKILARTLVVPTGTIPSAAAV